MNAIIGILIMGLIAVGITLAASGNLPGDWTGFNLKGGGEITIEPKGGLVTPRPSITPVPKADWCQDGYSLIEIDSITRDGLPRVVEICERIPEEGKR